MSDIRPLLVAYLFQMRILAQPDEGGRSSLPIIPLFDDVISCFLSDENIQKDRVFTHWLFGAQCNLHSLDPRPYFFLLLSLFIHKS